MWKKRTWHGRRGPWLWMKRTLALDEEDTGFGRRGHWLWKNRTLGLEEEDTGFGRRGHWLWKKRTLPWMKRTLVNCLDEEEPC